MPSIFDIVLYRRRTTHACMYMYVFARTYNFKAPVLMGRCGALFVHMAGLGLFFHKSALALVPRGLLQSAYDFLCLIYEYDKQKGPGHRGMVQGSFNPRSKLHAIFF